MKNSKGLKSKAVSNSVAMPDARFQYLKKLKKAMELLKWEDLSKNAKFNRNLIALQPCHVRRCSFMTLRDDSMSIAGSAPRADGKTNTNIRGKLCEAIADGKQAGQLQSLYNDYNLCEAPMNFDSNYLQMFPTRYSAMSYILPMSYLHLLYGESVLPFVYILDTSGQNLTSVRYGEHMLYGKDFPFPRTFEDILSYMRSKLLSLLLVFVAAAGEGTTGHAVVMVLWYDYGDIAGTLRAGVIDPVMDTKYQNKYEKRLYEFLDFYAEDYDFIVQRRMYDPVRHPKAANIVSKHIKHRFHKTYQSINNGYPYSSLDRDGYCAVWTTFIIESIARAHIQGIKVERTPLELLYYPQVALRPEHWRKFALDYLFTRMVNMYVLAKVMKRDSLAVFLKRWIVDKYLAQLDTTAMYKSIKAYVPDYSVSLMAGYMIGSNNKKRKADKNI